MKSYDGTRTRILAKDILIDENASIFQADDGSFLGYTNKSGAQNKLSIFDTNGRAEHIADDVSSYTYVGAGCYLFLKEGDLYYMNKNGEEKKIAKKVDYYVSLKKACVQWLYNIEDEVVDIENKLYYNDSCYQSLDYSVIIHDICHNFSSALNECSEDIEPYTDYVITIDDSGASIATDGENILQEFYDSVYGRGSSVTTGASDAGATELLNNLCELYGVESPESLTKTTFKFTSIEAKKATKVVCTLIQSNQDSSKNGITIELQGQSKIPPLYMRR